MQTVVSQDADRLCVTSVDVYGVSAQVITPLDDFADFVRRNYVPFLASDHRAPRMRTVFSPAAGEEAAEIAPALRSAGMGIRFDESRLYWENEFGFRVLVTLTKTGGFEILAYHDDLHNSQDADARYRNFQRSLRWVVHFPVFVQLRARLGWTLMHASAVADNDGAVVLCGLNKVGKSTLAMTLCRRRGYRFMTDNFLFATDDRVCGFPEVARLDDRSLEFLDMQPAPGRCTVYGKHHLPTNPADICLQAPPKVFFLVTVGEQVEVTRLNTEAAWRRVQGLHAFLSEFPESSYLAMLPLLEHGRLDAHSTMPEAARQAPWYQLTYPLNWNLEHIMEVVDECT